MPFSQVSYSDMDDFVTKMDTFLVANGWTQDDLDTGANEAAWHKGTIYFQVTWDAINRMGVYQSLSHDGSAPGANPDDAGPLSGTREILWSNGAGTADFFSGTEQSSEFFFAAIEYTPGLYAYLGAGQLIKKGTWTGGEFVTHQQWGIGGGALDDPFNSVPNVLVDGRYTGNGTHATTLHSEGWPSQDPAAKWAAVGGTMSDFGDDRAGEDREGFLGGMRDSFVANAFDFIDFQPNSGLVPLQTVEVWRREGPLRLAGFVPGLRGLKITNVDVREELPVGADTWRAYPWVRKTNAGGGQAESENFGLAILKTP